MLLYFSMYHSFRCAQYSVLQLAFQNHSLCSCQGAVRSLFCLSVSFGFHFRIRNVQFSTGQGQALKTIQISTQFQQLPLTRCASFCMTCTPAFILVCFRLLSEHFRSDRPSVRRLPFGFRFLPRKEVIQPHLPIRLPCYDFTPVIDLAFGSSPLAVRILTSGTPNSHGVTGGVYKARERIHRGMLIRDY